MNETRAPRLAAVLLAAGASKRLGQSKQLLRMDGESLVRRAAKMLLTLQVQPLVVVTGHRSEEITRELEGLQLTAVRNRNWKQGMGNSISRGVQSVPGEVDGVMLMLCDQWRVTGSDLTAIVSAWQSDISRIYTATWRNENGFISGPPAIFPCNLIHELKIIDNDRGAKAIINRHDNVGHVVMENAAYDLDSQEDLEELVNPGVQPRPPGRNPGDS